MWVLSALLAFVRLQNFAPEDSSLFNTLVTSLSQSLAHQSSLTATNTAFMCLKQRSFYLSHLPAYFYGVNKRSMLSSPLVLASSLFSDSDVSRLLGGHPNFLFFPFATGPCGCGLLWCWCSVPSLQHLSLTLSVLSFSS